MLIVNDRADVAVLAGAAGVHVGQDDLSPGGRAPRRAGPRPSSDCRRTPTAKSTAALTQPISYLAVGPVFWTATKDTGYERVGLALVERGGAARRTARHARRRHRRHHAGHARGA